MQKEKTVNELLIELHQENENLKEQMQEIKKIEESYLIFRFGYTFDELMERIKTYEERACEERRKKHEQSCNERID